ncbi:MAG: hypothetical protein JXB00_14625 [Bacteroidales bacterium]|nr:hypothetical protein [Bacteroidales bacterium]
MKNFELQTINNHPQWKRMYIIGAISAIIGLGGIILDSVFGSILGTDLTLLPHSAVDRFIQFNENCLIGLYYLDFLNLIIQIITIPAYIALFAAHLNTRPAMASLSLIVFLIGSTVFICGNTALSMFELSHKYVAASTEEDKLLLSAAGEALLAKGAHGSPGVFLGFLLPTFGALLMAFTMLRGKVFGKFTAIAGISGNILMVCYLIMIAFLPSAQKHAMAFAMPGGILLMLWMILFSIKLIKLGHPKTD